MSSLKNLSHLKRYGLQPFENLKTSTSTVMIYTNVNFNIKNIFESLAIHDIDAPLTKKQKNVDKKKILSSYGTIISVQSTTLIRGVDLRKKKKTWCTVCRPYKPHTGEESEKKTKLYTVTDYLVDVDEESDIRAIKYYCWKCNVEYDPWDLKKINHFLNQLTVVLSVGKNPMLNIMVFKDNLKIAGCKNIDDAVEALMILWQDYIVKDPNLWSLKKGATTPRFQIERVMKNVDFKLGFPIERNELNILMNDPKYSKMVFMSQYESTTQPCVNIKMYSVKPENFKYDCLVIPLPDDDGEERNPYFVKVPSLTYKNPKKKNKGGKYITFIVFSSSEVILSGRYDENMKEMYEFFTKVAFANRKKIEEVLYNADEDEINKIKSSKA